MKKELRLIARKMFRDDLKRSGDVELTLNDDGGRRPDGSGCGVCVSSYLSVAGIKFRFETVRTFRVGYPTKVPAMLAEAFLGLDGGKTIIPFVAVPVDDVLAAEILEEAA